MPFYVSPEQAMKDKADYARKGIARGRSGVVLQYDGGILFAAPNPSTARSPRWAATTSSRTCARPGSGTRT
jgi:proteasome alpha subunit